MNHATLAMPFTVGLARSRASARPAAWLCCAVWRPTPGRRYSSAATPTDPLRILFCGSDDFSCASLQALHAEMQTQRPDSGPGRIASLDVLVRPAKRTGRGLKTLHESPVKRLAASLGLRVYERDTFTGWQPPNPFNVIVAVSFGLFVPPRLLRSAAYGGLNVHPSLLPDLRGAAPIEHALLAGRAHTGVSVQTLDERTFDGGRILLQGPEQQETGTVGLAIPPRATAADLRRVLAPLGADLLVQVLRRGLYLSHSAAAPARPGPPPLPAPKLTKADRQVEWRSTDDEAAPASAAERIDRRARALGPLWTHIVRRSQAGEAVRKRAILEEVACVDCPPARIAGAADGDEPTRAVTFVQTTDAGTETQVVLPVLTGDDGDSVLVPAGSARCLRIRTIKIEGERSKPAAQALAPFVQQVGADQIAWDVVGHDDQET